MQIEASDGYQLAATHYEGGPDAILIASAMGVPRRYYDAFARFAVDAGFSVVTFDYRGIGDSRPRSLRGFSGSMRDWGALDLPAAIRWTRETLQPRSLALVGHSAGGQLMQIAPNAGEIDRLVFVAAQSGYWRCWPGLGAYRLGFLWLIMPSVSALFGYFPSRVVGLGAENLPREVASQWARWGRGPRYLFDEYRVKVRAPILAWSFADDTYAPRAAVETLLREHPEATITHRHEPPSGIKHFGFFRERLGKALWQQTIDWLTRDRDRSLSIAADAAPPDPARPADRPR